MATEDNHSGHPAGQPVHRSDEGTMDTRPHEETFAWFLSFVQWAGIAIAVILVFLALVNA